MGIRFALRQVTVYVPPGSGSPSVPAPGATAIAAAAAADEGAAPVSP